MAIFEGILVATGKTFLDAVSPAIKEKFEEFSQKIGWHSAQINYYEKIEKTYGWTRILGKHEPVSLEGIFTDVYLLDKPTAFKRFDILQLQNDPESIIIEENRISGLDLVKGGELQRLYILGKPGAGKTTFLRYVALQASQNKIKKIPIFISLNDWANSGDKLIDFIITQFDICDFPESRPLIEYILETGQAIVLFDGLDETQQTGGRRDNTITEIRNFSRKYDKSQILITCRIAATDYTFEEFTYLELADFTQEQVECYVNNWFGNDTEKLKQFKQEFIRDENKSLREMASTPLLLSLLCLNFDETGSFPNRRVEIYEEGINALLHKWDSSRSIKRDEIYQGLSIGRKRQMFARIAAQTFQKNQYFLRSDELSEMIVEYLSQMPDAPPKVDINGNIILKAIEAQHGIFVERAKEVYSFSHLTFQEYFTAKFVVDNAAQGSLKKLISLKNLTDKRWREVILNTASLLDDASLFFERFQSESYRSVSGEKYLNELFEWLKNKEQSINSPLRKVIMNVLYCYLESVVFYSYRETIGLISSESKPSNLKSIYNLNNSYKSSLENCGVIANLLINEISGSDSSVTITNYLFKSILNTAFPQSLNDCVDYAFNVVKDNEIKQTLGEELTLDINLYFSYLTLLMPEPNVKNPIWGKIIEIWKVIHNDCLIIGETDLANGIQEFVLSKKHIQKENIKNLRNLIQNRRNILHIWRMASIEIRALSSFFESLRFLNTCLELAVIPKRQILEDTLLLPK